jgi:arsenical pump membrane protein
VPGDAAQVGDHLASLAPALAFLCVGVPLAALLERLGFFEAVAVVLERRRRGVPVGALWLLAATTTALLNLDTTVVLLTPLYVRLARRGGVPVLAVAAIPLLLASLASSILPVSNLTTLIAVERLDLGTGEVVAHLAPASVVACVVGWLAYRRRHPGVIPAGPPGEVDRRALVVGGAAVAVLLVGFTAGAAVGVAPWVVVLAVDAALAVALRWVPWRTVPVGTALGVAGLAVVAAVALPAGLLGPLLEADAPGALAGVVLAGAAVADVVNNLPATLVALDGASGASWGLWAWLTGTNIGAVLFPVGALANLLWWRIARDEGVGVTVGGYLAVVVPVAVPALAAAAATVGVQRLLAG